MQARSHEAGPALPPANPIPLVQGHCLLLCHPESANPTSPERKTGNNQPQKAAPRHRLQTLFQLARERDPGARFGLTLRCRNVLEIPLPAADPKASRPSFRVEACQHLPELPSRAAAEPDRRR